MKLSALVDAISRAPMLLGASLLQIEMEVNQFIEVLGHSNITYSILHASLKSICEFFFVAKRGSIALSSSNLHLFPQISERVSTCQLIAFSLSQESCPFQRSKNCEKARAAIQFTIDDPTLSNVLSGELADLHRHLKGSLLPELVITEDYRSLSHIKDEDCKNTSVLLLLLRDALARCAEKGGRADHREVARLKRILAAGQGFTQGSRLALPMCHRRRNSPAETLAAEVCFLCGLFRFAKSLNVVDSYNTHIFTGLHKYIVGKNLQLRRFVQPTTGQEGLHRFQHSFYEAPLRKAVEKCFADSQTHLRQAFDLGKVTNLELRVSPDPVLIDRIRVLKKSFLLGGTDSQLEQRIGIIVHFLRECDPTDKKVATGAFKTPIFHRTRRRVWKEALQLERILHHPLRESPVVGIDIAGIEHAVPTEVFAPVMRWLRKKERVDRPLGVTCHAGEDFLHLVSGMRAIDEALTFLKLRRGDRIGHALALGYEPSDWQKRVGDSILLSAGEHFDNLVWLLHWGRIARIDAQILADWRRDAENLNWSLHHGPFCEAVAYEAWHMRMFSPGGSETFSLTHAPQDETFIEASRNKQALGLWSKYLTDARLHFERSKLIRSSIVHAHLGAFRDIQDAILNVLIDNAIAIEANPSSNLRIGLMSNLTEHPIFRWVPISRQERTRKGALVVLGTDDPGVFGSEIHMEYLLLGSAARCKGSSIREIQEWLEDIRETSLRYSFAR